MVSQVNLGLVGCERVRSDGGGGQHHLDAHTCAVLQGGEAKFSAVAHQHHTAGDSHHIVGLFTGFQMSIRLAHLSDGRRDRQFNRVGLLPLVQHGLTFTCTDPHLFRRVVTALSRFLSRSVRIVVSGRFLGR